MTPDLCIYHANCMDGFTAAWVVKRRFPDVELMPASYGDSPPTAVGRYVLIVDFSYSHEQLVELGQRAAQVVVLDHHKTAAEALMPFEAGEMTWATDPEVGVTVRAHFDMEKSGARLAWEYCNGDTDAPPIVAYTEDRDLWRWELAFSREVNAALGSYDQTFEKWTVLNRSFSNSRGETLIEEGRAILRQRMKDVRAAVDTTKRQMVIGGHLVTVSNVPFFFASEAGEMLLNDAPAPFVGSYFDNGEARIFSLRSNLAAGGLDVSAIAKGYGGGGHAGAAGFKMPRGWEGDETPSAMLEALNRQLELHAGIRP